jgi:hypothetical protein
MDLIDAYLKKENSLDLTDDDGNEISDDQKLEFFFNLFIDLEKSFRDNVLELNRLNEEHRDEINEVKLCSCNVYAQLYYFRGGIIT